MRSSKLTALVFITALCFTASMAGAQCIESPTASCALNDSDELFLSAGTQTTDATLPETELDSEADLPLNESDEWVTVHLDNYLAP